jgi:hypothetical protein
MQVIFQRGGVDNVFCLNSDWSAVKIEEVSTRVYRRNHPGELNDVGNVIIGHACRNTLLVTSPVNVSEILPHQKILVELPIQLLHIYRTEQVSSRQQL